MNGTRLKLEMEARDISIAALSLRTRIPERTIVRYRTARSTPRDAFGRPTSNALQIARVLGVDADELFPPRTRTAA